VRFVHKESGRRGAYADRRFRRRPVKAAEAAFVDICVLENDERGVPAKLHREALDSLRALPNEKLPDARGTGEANLATLERHHTALDDRLRRPEQQVDGARGQASPGVQWQQNTSSRQCMPGFLRQDRKITEHPPAASAIANLRDARRDRKVPGRQRENHADRFVRDDGIATAYGACRSATTPKRPARFIRAPSKY